MVPVTTLRHKTTGRRPHRRAVLLSWIVILALLGGCFPPAGEMPPQEKPPEPPHTLVGTWVRPLRDRPEETEASASMRTDASASSASTLCPDCNGV